MHTRPLRRRPRLRPYVAAVVVAAASLLGACATVADDVGSGPSPAGSVAAPAATVADPGAFVLLEAATIPAAALEDPDTAGIAAEVSWRDTLGEHRVVLRKEVDYVSADPADGVARVLLTARHYVAGAAGGDASVAARVETESPPCPRGDLADDVWPTTLSAADANGDGVGEASFVLTSGCVTDGMPVVTAYAMTADAVYRVSGPRPVPGEAGPTQAAEADPSLPGDAVGERLIALWGAPLERAATAVDWRDGSAGVLASVSRVLAEYGQDGPLTAVPPNAGTPGTAGSGCVVEPGDTLPDGIWAGYLNAADGVEAAFDVVCFLTVTAAQEAGVDSSFAGFRVDDDSEGQRPVRWDEDATLHVQTNPPPRPVTEDSTTVSLAAADAERVQAYLREFPGPFGWLLVEDGRAVEFWSPPLAGG